MRWPSIQSGMLGAVIAVTGALASCAGPRGAGGGASQASETGGAEIGLRRGSAWTTISVKPPHLVGPNSNMLLHDGVLTGTISGAPLSVRIRADGADGYGPTGSVALHLVDKPGVLDVSGTWNGYRVHFEMGDDSLRGTVAQTSDSLTIDPRRQPMMPELGVPDDLRIHQYTSCEYTLGERSRDGALTGTSTCGGMPEPTRLEVPGVVRAYMTRPELVVVLVALLAAPPTVGSERIGG